MNTKASEQKSEEQRPFRLNAYQKAAVSVYGEGDFAYLADMEFKNYDEFHSRVRSCGDGLLTFMLLELADSDCASVEEARNHISRVIDSMNDVLGELHKIEDEPESPAPGM